MSKLKDDDQALIAEPAADEFTALCTYYYRLTAQRKKRLAHLIALEENAPVFTLDENHSTTQLFELDAIIKYYREGQIKKAKLDTIEEDIRKVKLDIQYLFQFFSIPAYHGLQGQIPGVLEYEVFADHNGEVFIYKTADIAPEALPGNVIVIKTSFWKDEEED